MGRVATICVLVALVGCSSLRGMSGQQTVQGRIAELDRAGGVVRLVGGMVIWIPPNISSGPLEPGEEVTIAYRLDPSGRKVMTAVWVNASPNDSGM